jgi:mono/diheme cytochrome c family protein
MSLHTTILFAAALVTLSLSFASAQDIGDLEQRGRVILAANCARCHAIERTGDSPHRAAPAFRTLGQRYPIDSLAEALAEGLVTGHPDMPEFVFDVEDVGAILAYLKSIQNPAKP